MNSKEFIEDIKPIRNEISERIGRDRAILYIIILLRKEGFEALYPEITVASCKLFPLFFSLKGDFSEYPDGRKVRDVLLHLTYKTKLWATGSQQSGYKPTRKGIEIFENEISPLLSGKVFSTRTYSTGDDKQEYFIKRCRNTDAFRKFMQGRKDEIEGYEIRYLLKTTRETPEDILKNKLEKLISYYKSRSHDDLKTDKGGKIIFTEQEWLIFGEMLDYIRNNFSKLLGDSNENT